jgi:archaeal flagellar protein FlaI
MKLAKNQPEKKKEEKKEDKKEEKTEKELVEERIKLEPIKIKEEEPMQILETYPLEVDKARVNVDIKKGSSGVLYYINIPEIKVATLSLLSEIRNDLVATSTLSMKEITDVEAFYSIKERFMRDSTALLKLKMPTVDKPTEEFLIGKLMQDMLGLGEIEFMVNDPHLEEIVIPNAKEPIRVYHKKYGWIKTSLTVKNEEDIVNYSNIIARRVGRQITVLNPLLDAHLVSGDRCNSILYPISSKGSTITLRKFARDPYTIIDLIKSNTISLECSAVLWLAVEYEMNVLISGGTASGKTVLLNALMPFIPPYHRVVSVEDTRELMLPEFLYWCPLVTRTPNPEGKGEVSMLDLLVNSLRMRPDRIILGEMRRQQEAMVLFEAMHTGHSVYATLHADSASETVSRLTNPPLNIPPNLLKAVNLNAVMFRDRRTGRRRVIQIAEFNVTGNTADANVIYRWVPEDDTFAKFGESSRFYEDLTRHTGLNPVEINNNLEMKKKILNYLLSNSVRDLGDVGKVMSMYYSNKPLLLESIDKDDFAKIFGRDKVAKDPRLNKSTDEANSKKVLGSSE